MANECSVVGCRHQRLQGRNMCDVHNCDSPGCRNRRREHRFSNRSHDPANERYCTQHTCVAHYEHRFCPRVRANDSIFCQLHICLHCRGVTQQPAIYLHPSDTRVNLCATCCKPLSCCSVVRRTNSLQIPKYSRRPALDLISIGRQVASKVFGLSYQHQGQKS